MEMKPFINAFLPLLIIFLVCSDTFGESADTLKYDFNFQLGGQKKGGIISQTTVKVRSNTKLENEKLIVNSMLSYTYNKVNDNRIADDWHIRTLGLLKLNSIKKILPLFGHNYLKNVLYRILKSNRAFGGVRIIPMKQFNDFSFTFGAGYELTQYPDEVFINSTLTSNHREFVLGFFNLLGKHKVVNNKILFEYNLSFIQSFEEFKDFAFWATSGISIPIGKHLFLGINYDFRYRNVRLVDLPPINDLLLFNVKFDISN